MKIFVFEFFSGGGGASYEVSNSILSEGYAMLNSITSDFSKTGNEIITTLDYRIKRFNPPLNADKIIDISIEDDFNSKFDQILTRDIDAAFLIAPETDEILYDLARQVEKLGITLLGPSSSSIKLTTDKHETNKKVKKLARIPRSEVLPIDAPPNVIFQASKKVGLPFVMKPLDGVACSGISLIKGEQEIPNGLKKIKSESVKDHFMIQEYVKGIDASLSILIGQNRVFPLTLNFQNVDLETSTYLGGYTPFDHPLKEKIIERSIKIVREISGLRGYVGLDYVVTDDDAFFMEINPRLTTSYVGIRVICRQNIAESIIDLIIYGKNLPEFEFIGYSHFSKVDLIIPKFSMEKFRRNYFKNNIAAPPFVVKGKENEVTSAFIFSHHENLIDSKMQFERIERNLLERSEIT